MNVRAANTHTYCSLHLRFKHGCPHMKIYMYMHTITHIFTMDVWLKQSRTRAAAPHGNKFVLLIFHHSGEKCKIVHDFNQCRLSGEIPC